MTELVIKGRPVSQKNSRTVKRFGRKLIPTPSGAVTAYKQAAMIQLRNQWRGRDTITAPVFVSLIVYQAKGQSIDLDNAIQAPLDALQAAKVIDNDYQAAHIDARRARDPVNPRVELWIEELTGETR